MRLNFLNMTVCCQNLGGFGALYWLSTKKAWKWPFCRQNGCFEPFCRQNQGVNFHSVRAKQHLSWLVMIMIVMKCHDFYDFKRNSRVLFWISLQSWNTRNFCQSQNHDFVWKVMNASMCENIQRNLSEESHEISWKVMKVLERLLWPARRCVGGAVEWTQGGWWIRLVGVDSVWSVLSERTRSDKRAEGKKLSEKAKGKIDRETANG